MELAIKNITKTYGSFRALNQVNAVLSEGVYGLLGPNGAGKTTLMRILLGILGADNGTIYFNQKDVSKMGGDYLNLIGYLPQYPKFYPNFKVTEFLLYICALKAIPKAQAKQRVVQVLELVNMTDAAHKKIGALSGGMRQRVGIAQAILNDPKILVLDEPTAGLDPRERIRFRNLISKLADERIVLLATHIVSDVECIAKEILLLKEGELVLQGNVQTLENCILGKVWELDIPAEELDKYLSCYTIGNVKVKSNLFSLRIVHDNVPAPEAVPVTPTLEDVFLYHFMIGGEQSDASGLV